MTRREHPYMSEEELIKRYEAYPYQDIALAIIVGVLIGWLFWGI